MFRRLRYFLRRRRNLDDLVEEMEFHRSLSGARAFGNATLAREDSRGVWTWAWVESVQQDVRYTLRSLGRRPGLALAALPVLGAAIGLNVSLFTVFNALMQQPWPVAEPARVASVFDLEMRSDFSLAELGYFARHSRAFEGLVGTRCIDGGSDGCRVKLDDRPVNADFVTPNYFDVLHIGLARGAGFVSRPDFPESRAADAIISHAAWMKIFEGDERIIGRQNRLDDVAFTIVGGAPESFSGVSIERKDIWIPIAAIPLLRPDQIFDDVRREAAVAGSVSNGVRSAFASTQGSGLELRPRGPVPGPREAAHRDLTPAWTQTQT